MNKYDNYQVSPVLWNNAFPAHWKFKRGKNLYRKENRPTSSTDKVVTCFRDGTVTLRQNRRTTGFTEAIQEIGYQGIKKGDLVIHVMDAFAGSIGVSDSDGKGTPVYSVCTAKEDANNHYYAYLLREIARKGYIQSLYRGIRERSSDFRFEIFATQFYPVPSRAEQDQIVRFLDWKTSRINRLINVYKKEIAYVVELKKAIISQTVTRGLNPKVQMKYSGTDWLGNIPRHWELMRGKLFFTTKKQINKENVCSNVLSLTLNGVVNNDKENPIGLSPEDYSTYQIFEKNDLVFKLIDLENISTSRVGLVHEKGIMSSAYIRLTNRYDCNVKYFYYYYYEKYLRNIYNGLGAGVRSTLSASDLLNLPVCIPPRAEQDQIVEFLDKKASAFQRIIDIQAKRIELLKEYKNRLISDVVTGQIDVRDVEIPEYEHVEEIADSNSEDDEAELEEAGSEVE